MSNFYLITEYNMPDIFDLSIFIFEIKLKIMCVHVCVYYRKSLNILLSSVRKYNHNRVSNFKAYFDLELK